VTGIGNDIVALNAINARRAGTKQFYSHVLSSGEVDFYGNSAIASMPFENYVWLMWSVKEAAYKLLRQHDETLLFAPVRINIKAVQAPLGHSGFNFGRDTIENCTLPCHGCYCSEVISDTQTLYARSIAYSTYIFTVVVADVQMFNHVYWGIRSIAATDHTCQSAEVRSFFLHRLTSMLPGAQLTLFKAPSGAPILMKDDIETGFRISFSHHHQFIAYSFLIPSERSYSSPGDRNVIR